MAVLKPPVTLVAPVLESPLPARARRPAGPVAYEPKLYGWRCYTVEPEATDADGNHDGLVVKGSQDTTFAHSP
ncbi:hypothetical protein GCM10017786_42450 [Amycolatopsis deserti]|uniref:Uncharacterized protein n=1 Tax=Amycolatopsis deserti TaxID=185696 RepID=A0ABQ3J5B7_9PSEU|nr:hypothetical protein [Amycolatopsis deserti]GHF04162.1 hypothetical protein GCM10017786_42450 [Amycolatopsis deserti]